MTQSSGLYFVTTELFLLTYHQPLSIEKAGLVELLKFEIRPLENNMPYSHTSAHICGHICLQVFL